MRATAGRRRVVVFGKPPLPGRVKTRLIPRLGSDGAAAIYEAFLADSLKALEVVDAELVVAWGIEAGEPLPANWSGRPRSQGDGDLGARLARVIGEESADGAVVVVVGSDHPELEAEVVESALGRLDSEAEDIVLGPTADGGYWLVGCRPGLATERLFAETEWSTDRVLATTLARATELELRCGLVAALDDVDTPADLDRLIERLGRGGTNCAATREALARLVVATP